MNIPSEAGLQARDVSFSYGTNTVVRDVSLRLEPGDFVALAGPNGSGKTTLLKMLSGACRPRRGTVTLNGDPITQFAAREVARHVAVVSQSVDPNLAFSVESMVAMGRTPYTRFLGYPTQEDRVAVERALEVTETTALARRRFSELSGGEQRRVIVAMALAQQSDFLLLDEPTVHLDLHHQHELLELLRALHSQRRIGILAVMHDLNLASLYFDRLAVLHNGSLVAEGPSAAVIDTPDALAVFRAPLSTVLHPRARVPQILLDRNSDSTS